MKTLIVYSSKYGCTEQCAVLLKERLEREATLCNAAEASSVALDEFDSVVIASPIYMGKILPPISRFWQRHRDQLLQKRLAVFICCGFVERAEEQMEAALPRELLAHAQFKENLGYAFDFEQMNFFDKLIVRLVGGAKTSQNHIHQDKIAHLAALINKEW